MADTFPYETLILLYSCCYSFTVKFEALAYRIREKFKIPEYQGFALRALTRTLLSRLLGTGWCLKCRHGKDVSWTPPSWNNFQNMAKTKVSRGFQYRAGGNSTYRLPCLLVSAQPSRYSKDGYIYVHIPIILEKYLALKEHSSFFVPFN